MSNTVLVVEDDPILRGDAATMLEEAGFFVVELESADEAMAFLVEQAGHVAAVFTDVQLPGHLDGLELAESIASNWPGVLVLVTSGNVERPADMPGSARFMRKPWRPLDVLTAIGGAAH